MAKNKTNLTMTFSINGYLFTKKDTLTGDLAHDSMVLRKLNFFANRSLKEIL